MGATIDERAGILAALRQFQDLGGTYFVHEMIDLLRTQTPEQFQQIDAALGNNDHLTAQRLAHSMKSSFGNFGAMECQQLATAMDAAGKSSDWNEYRASFVKLRAAFDRLLAILDADAKAIC